MFDLIKSDYKAATKQNFTVTGLFAYLYNPSLMFSLLVRTQFYLRQKGSVLTVFSVILNRLIIFLFGCHISSKAVLGESLFFPHPTGIVIGVDVVVGKNCTICQHVSLGAQTIFGTKYPNIGDGSIIYAGAVVAGDIKLRKNKVVSANQVIVGKN